VSLLPPTVQEETESEIETDVEEIAEQVPREILSQDEPPPAAPSPLAAAVPQPREVRAADQAYQPPPQPLSARSCACSTGGQALTPNYWDSVRNRIAACMRYPASARREGKDGVVVVRVEVDSEGGLVAATPLQEPGEPSLARAVVAGVRRAAPFGSPFGPDGKATNSVAASIVIRFELIQGVERARQESGNQPERRQG
jgi:TonB family protein